jgi:D-serine deaminase-like pyridoxal phosphate-dependent protein
MIFRDIETPCLLLDRAKLRANILAMHQRMAELGVNLRPHGKTAKNIDVMRLALAGQRGGITVSTLKEAEYYFENGVEDIVYAVGIAPVKLERVAKLMQAGASVTLLLDSLEQAEILARAGQQMQLCFPALIELDCDDHRSGVRADDPLLLEIAQLLHHSAGTQMRGVLTHAGGSYDCRSTGELQQMAQRERDAAVQAAVNLQAADLPCPVVSVGSTPTATFATDLDGVTEVRAGVFQFQDLVMAGLGVCKVEDIAVSVLTSVIGHQPQKNWILIDAGWMALSRDRGTSAQKIDQGYGLVCAADGTVYPDLIVSGTNQEHGIISQRNGGGIVMSEFPVGTQLRILPNHACATTAMFDRYTLIPESNSAQPTHWHRVNGW